MPNVKFFTKIFNIIYLRVIFKGDLSLLHSVYFYVSSPVVGLLFSGLGLGLSKGRQVKYI